MTASTIERQLLKVTKYKYEGKRRQKQLRELAHAVAGMQGDAGEDAWRSLSDAAQSWYNAAADAISAGAKISDFPDLAAAEEPVAKAKVNAKGNGQAGRAAAKKTGRSARGLGAVAIIHTALVKNRDVTTAELIPMLRAKGNKAKRSTVGTQLSRDLDLMRRLHADGQLKGKAPGARVRVE